MDNWYTVRDGISADKLIRALSIIARNDQEGKLKPARKMIDGQGLRLVA